MAWSILRLLRENPDVLRRSLQRRGLDPSLIDKAIELDRLWRQKVREVDEIRHKHNLITRKIASTRDPGEKRKLIEEAKRLIKRRQELEEELKRITYSRRTGKTVAFTTQHST